MRLFRVLLLVLALLVATPSLAADFLLLNAVTVTGVSGEITFPTRTERSYWFTITGTASVNIEMAPRLSDPFVPLVTGITTSGFVDTKAPGIKTRVNVITCTSCTVTVLLQVGP